MWQERSGSIAAVRTVWRAAVEDPGRYAIAGSEHWGIAFIRRIDGTLAGELDGPTLHVHEVNRVKDERYWGVELTPWVTVRDLPKQPILGLTLPLEVSQGKVRLGDRLWAVPDFEGLESWVEDLLNAGVLVVDSEIRRVLGCDRVGATDRTWQRRYRRVVGLTAAQVEQTRAPEQTRARRQTNGSAARPTGSRRPS